jgi:hypothetical protein
VNDGDRRLVALAALFAPASAQALLGRAAGGAADLPAQAARLAGAPRRERLRTLAAALAVDTAAARRRADVATALERPRVAAVLRAVAGGAPHGVAVSAPLVRLCRERVGR